MRVAVVTGSEDSGTYGGERGERGEWNNCKKHSELEEFVSELGMRIGKWTEGGESV